MACGSASEQRDLEPRSTRASFVRDANAVCRKYRKRFAAVEPIAEVEDIARWAAEIGDVIEAGLREQAAVRRPRELDARYREYLRLAHEQLRVVRQIEEAGRRRDVVAYDRLFPLSNRIDERADAVGRSLGLNECVGG
jgi:hypothetical protein